MLRALCLAIIVTLPACAAVKSAPRGEAAYSGTVQRAYAVTKQGKELPGVGRLLGKYANTIGPKLRRSGETNQYVVRTPTGQVMAQSDDEFEVGDCVDVIALGSAEGPAYRLGEVQLLPSQKCTTLTAGPAQRRD